MRRTPTCSIVLFALGLAASLSEASAQTIRGVLLDGSNDQPIDLARVAMIDAGGDTVATSLTDETGLFVVSARRGGQYRLVARALGYRAKGAGPFEMESGELRVEYVTLEPAPVAIPGVDVETEGVTFEEAPYLSRQGFYERRRMEIGHFLGPEELAREVPLITFTGELLRRMPGVFVGADGRRVRLRNAMGGMCNPTVLLDGIRVSTRWSTLDDLVRPESLDGVEVYARAGQVPMQYRGAEAAARSSVTDPRGGPCGVVIFWTKH